MDPRSIPTQDTADLAGSDSTDAAGDWIREGADFAPAGRVRLVIAKLRDVNLRDETIALDGDRSVQIGGCLSLDQPAERCLRYRLVRDGREAQSLEIVLRERCLWVERRSAQRELLFESELDFLGSEAGELVCPQLRIRIDPEAAGAREIEHLLRRLVRSAFPSN